MIVSVRLSKTFGLPTLIPLGVGVGVDAGALVGFDSVVSAFNAVGSVGVLGIEGCSSWEDEATVARDRKTDATRIKTKISFFIAFKLRDVSWVKFEIWGIWIHPEIPHLA